MKNIFLLLSILSVLSVGCTSSHQNYTRADGYQEETYGSLDKNKSALLEQENKGVQERKILYQANVRLTVKIIDTTIAQLTQIAKEHKGYVNQAGTYQTIIRVGKGEFEKALAKIEKLGKLRHKNVIGQDVTNEYSDTQIRLDNAQKARKRYLELLAKAENVEAALKVEKELERLNEKIELFKGRMNRMNHLSEYSTITIYLKEKKKPGVLGYIGLGLYHSVRWLFVRN